MSKPRKPTRRDKLIAKLWKRMLLAHSALEALEINETILPIPTQRRINALAHTFDDWAKTTEQAIEFIDNGVQDG
jgi:hypothetical protein